MQKMFYIGDLGLGFNEIRKADLRAETAKNSFLPFLKPWEQMALSAIIKSWGPSSIHTSFPMP
jgi:hypothetical protein